MTDVQIIGIKEFQNAIRRNPIIARKEAGTFMKRSFQAYRAVIDNNSWRVGQGGGGVPVASQSLKREHNWDKTFVGISTNPFHGEVGFNADISSEGARQYGIYVHEGTRFMKKRPWLDYAVKNADGKVQNYYRAMLGNIVKDLAK